MVTFCLWVVKTMANYPLGKLLQQAVTLAITVMLCLTLLDSFILQNCNSILRQTFLIPLPPPTSPTTLPFCFSRYLVFLDFTCKCYYVLFSVPGLWCSSYSPAVAQMAGWHTIVCTWKGSFEPQGGHNHFGHN